MRQRKVLKDKTVNAKSQNISIISSPNFHKQFVCAAVLVLFVIFTSALPLRSVVVMDPSGRRINMGNEFNIRQQINSVPVRNQLAPGPIPDISRLPISRIDTYELASKRHGGELVWEEIGTGKLMRLADVTRRLRTRGPVVASFYKDDSIFRNWSRELARSVVFVGLPFVEGSDAERGVEQAGDRHDVVVIGFGGEGDGAYFVGQNSYGTEWGDGGFFRLCPKCVGYINIMFM